MNQKSVIVKKSSINGKGVFAARDFKKGEVVVHWNIEKELSPEDIARLTDTDKKYVSKIEPNKFVLIGKPARYVNHSCEPNTGAYNGSDVALRDIVKGEEITADYDQEKVPIHFICHCGSKNCRINIGEKTSKKVVGKNISIK